jgi:hypothetical protein
MVSGSISMKLTGTAVNVTALSGDSGSVHTVVIIHTHTYVLVSRALFMSFF